MSKTQDMVCSTCGRRWDDCPNQQNHQPVTWSDAGGWQPRTYHSDALGAVTIPENDPIERDGHAFRDEGDMEAWDLYGGDEDDA